MFEEFEQYLREDVLQAAPKLLGWHLVYEDLRAQIVEVEAYRTPDDPGCHAHRGETPRNRAMFGEPGRAYMYFTYGNHWMLNLTAQEPGIAAAILIRAAKPLGGLETFYARRPKAKRDTDLLSGPGKLTAAFGLDGSHYGHNLLGNLEGVHLEPGSEVKNVVIGTRIGLSPGMGDDLPWRYCDAEEMQWVSKPWPK